MIKNVTGGGVDRNNCHLIDSLKFNIYNKEREMKKIITATKQYLYIKNDIYKSDFRTRIYLDCLFFKLPLLLKQYKGNRIYYRLFFVLPLLRKNATIERLNFISQTQNNYKNIIQKIQLSSNTKPIRVGFLIGSDTAFGGRAVFEKMLLDSTFEACVIVVPHTSMDEEQMFSKMAKTYKSLCSSYPQHTNKILCSYDKGKKDFIDYSSTLDIIYFDNPYDSVTHKFYTILYLSQFALTIYIPYGYTGYLNFTVNVYATLAYSLLWNICVENQNNYELIKSHQMAKVENLNIAGYPKLDSLAELLAQEQETIKKRKQIIIAPHHTLTLKDFSLYLSNFVRLSEFFLKLPKLYPQIDFIFRPHPLLFTQIIRFKIYGGEDNSQLFVKNYLQSIEQIPNMTYQEGGDYFKSFATADALIHDCGGFTAEWLYTDKPEAFIIESSKTIEREFTPFGKEMLNHLYLVSSEKDIIDFIDSVVLQGQDSMKHSRVAFAQKYIRIHYPNSTQMHLDKLKTFIKAKQ